MFDYYKKNIEKLTQQIERVTANEQLRFGEELIVWSKFYWWERILMFYKRPPTKHIKSEELKTLEDKLEVFLNLQGKRAYELSHIKYEETEKQKFKSLIKDCLVNAIKEINEEKEKKQLITSGRM